MVSIWEYLMIEIQRVIMYLQIDESSCISYYITDGWSSANPSMMCVCVGFFSISSLKALVWCRLFVHQPLLISRFGLSTRDRFFHVVSQGAWGLPILWRAQFWRHLSGGHEEFRAGRQHEWLRLDHVCCRKMDENGINKYSSYSNYFSLGITLFWYDLVLQKASGSF